jgi:hypothetical protein
LKQSGLTVGSTVAHVAFFYGINFLLLPLSKKKLLAAAYSFAWLTWKIKGQKGYETSSDITD